MTDRRMIKTKKALFSALGRLLKRNEFDRITVSDIVREAGVTRKTFYNHYQDKIGMVQDYQRELSEEIRLMTAGRREIGRDFFVELFTLIGKQDDLLAGLFSANGSPVVQDIMKGTMRQYCLEMTSDPDEDLVFLEYHAVMLSNIIFGVVQHWLTTGKKTTPEETADILMRLHFPVTDAEGL